ncbi:hypothetical protein J3A64_001779 [Pseudarthrobacter sp. PvP004]|nr:hypothetical protein [Pseudarthrobacter sp. PvP004]
MECAFVLYVSDFWIGIVVTAVLALLGSGVAIGIYRKQNPRLEFSHEVRSAPLISRRSRRGLPKLSVAYEGSTVPNPYLVTIEIASTGRADISSTRFDGQKPILFQLKVPVIDEIEQTPSSDSLSARLEFTPGHSTIMLAPTLLPKGFSIRATYLCDGKPQHKAKIELADITIRDGSLPRSRGRSGRIMSIVAGLVALGLGLASLVQAWVAALRP